MNKYSLTSSYMINCTGRVSAPKKVGSLVVIEVIRLTILEIDNFNGFGNKKVKGQIYLG